MSENWKFTADMFDVSSHNISHAWSPWPRRLRASFVHFFLVDVRDKWSSFDMNIPTWNAQSKVGNQRCEKWQTLDTESATNFWMTFIMQAQRPSELNMLSTRRNINILIILFWCVLGVLYATEKLKYSELIRQRWREIETNTKKNQPRYWTTRFWWTNESKKKL